MNCVHSLAVNIFKNSYINVLFMSPGLKMKKKRVADGIVESEAAFCNVIAQNARTYHFHTPEYGRVSVEEYYWKRYSMIMHFNFYLFIRICY